MAKRSRGSARPGQLAPARRTATQKAAPRPATPAAAPAAGPPGSLTQAEAARAAELEAQIVAEERAAEATRRGSRKGRGAGDLAAAGARGESLILARAAQEYAYVARDLRRDAIVMTSLTGGLLLLWVLLEVVGIFG